jgi:lipopolysaccharide export system ATP-binding protein
MSRDLGLRCEGLRRSLGGRRVVDGVDFALAPREILGLLGPNGAGKTTLFRLISGVLSAEAGRIWLAEREISGLPQHRRARLGLGYLSQQSSAFSGLTVRQNIEAALELAVPKKTRKEARYGVIDELLELFGLRSLRDQKAKTLSGGERRRLEIARLLAPAPKVILLDEPFAGLDPEAVRELSEQVRLMSDRGAAVLLADHYVEQALTICQRACILVSGKVVARGAPAELVSDPAAKAAFFAPASRVSRSR